MIDHYQPCCCSSDEVSLLLGEKMAYVCHYCGVTPYLDGMYHDISCPRHCP